MPILRALAAALAWVGRQGTRALAISVFVGLALPQLAAYVKPWLGVIVFVMLLSSYLRTDPAAFARHFRSPGFVIVASLWIMAAMPLLFGGLYLVVGLREAIPSLFQIMILQLAIAPITSLPAFAALMGLDVALSLATLILTSALSPLSTTAFSYLFLGTAVISPIELGLKLLFFFASSAVLAYLIRKLAGQPRIERNAQLFDGINVLAAFVFAIAVMDGVPRHFMENPLGSLGILALGCATCVTFALVTFVVFLRGGRERALALGLLAAFRNLGVVMAAVGAALPDLAWFYFAMVQFPIYLMPALLKPLARRFTEKR